MFCPARPFAAYSSLALILFPAVVLASPANPTAAEIIKRSVAVNDSDWRRQPGYSHNERDVNAKINSSGKIASKQEKSFRVHMIEGTPYNELLAINGEPLSAVQKKQEQTKLTAEVKRRSNESSSARAARMGKYKKDRAEEHLLMHEMIAAFNFKLAGDARIDGRDCYVLDAAPNPNYRPSEQKARVLTGMKGRLWIDRNDYHWVRVHAQVVTPVDFGLFIAKVRPGTEFELDQKPVDGSVWLPSHFSQSVNARVLGVYGIRSREDDYFSDYQHVGSSASAKTGPMR